jgi:release factor glutamine methyltransferase
MTNEMITRKTDLGLSELRRLVASKLNDFGIEPGEANAEAHLIVEAITGKNLVAQVITDKEKISSRDWEAAENILAERKKRIPIQYILGETNFLNFRLKVVPGVFIPVTDTEVLVDVVLKMLTQGGQAYQADLQIAEIGVGCGPIAIGLLKNLDNCHIWACDINRQATELAYENACQHAVADRLKLVEGNWCEVMPYSRRFDAIVANPPYIPTTDKSKLDPEVALYGPQVALFDSDPQGLGFYRDFVLRADRNLKKDTGFIAVEVGDGQSELAKALFINNGWRSVLIHPDINGLNRVLTAQIPI